MTTKIDQKKYIDGHKMQAIEGVIKHQFWFVTGEQIKKQVRYNLMEWERDLGHVPQIEFDKLLNWAKESQDELDKSIKPVAAANISDPVNHPPHYKAHPSGIECIQITEHMGFCLGNAFKYVFRFAHKNGQEDLKKAIWYVKHEIKRRTIGEVWKLIPDLSGYEVSSLGNIRRVGCKNRKLVKLKNGYLTFGVRENGKNKLLYVHRCVANAFIGLTNLNVCHNDGSKDNNCYWNLRNDTQKNNLRDRYKHGTHFHGARNPAAKLTLNEVEGIKELFGKLTEVEAAAMHNVSRSTIGRIWRGVSWAYKESVSSISILIESEINPDIAHIFELLYNADSNSNEEPLEKAVWYIQREIEKRGNDKSKV